ncbi:YhcN/YlaJ family sporulation lipoprotein [Paenibacillus sp. FSL H8-0537]|uniref:YhcN/YlaJ family sporulation lipoprotein n=1 Tax=Paenibacillus sp. FSL H8-0537 TaxID=2921399 RepID=UPI003101A75F
MPKNRMLNALLCAALLVSSSTACNYEQRVQNSDYDYGSRKAGDPKMLGSKMYGTTTSNPHQHDNAFFEYSNTLSKKVTDLNGVASANVMLTDKNAYVGIVLDWTAVGTRGAGGNREQLNGGQPEDAYNTSRVSPLEDNRLLVRPYQSYFSVNDHNELSPELKQTIAKRIRELAPMVQEVHISANMDFVNQMNDYAVESWGGRPLTPHVDAFNTLVKYQFIGGKEMPKPIQSKKTP